MEKFSELIKCAYFEMRLVSFPIATIARADRAVYVPHQSTQHF